jgi:hypothetical protein
LFTGSVIAIYGNTPIRRLMFKRPVVTLAGVSLYGQHACHGPGNQRWPIKTSVPQGTDLKKAGKE